MLILTSLVGFFETLLGVILLCVSLVQFIMRKDHAVMFVTGLLSFSVGVWSLYMGNAMELFASDLTMITRVGHICLYFALIPLSVIIVMVRGIGEGKIRRIAAYTGIAIPVIYMITAYALNYSGYVFSQGLYDIFFIVAIGSVGLLLFATFHKNKTRHKKVLDIGIYVLYAGGIADVISYLSEHRSMTEEKVMHRSVMPELSLIFILIMIYSYMLSLNRLYMEQANDIALKNAAYTDTLTGLKNRAYCDYTLSRLALRPRFRYTIISLDVNGLKSVNDHFGHAAGDDLICDCANILSAVFDSLGDVIRMGGDEFVVIIDGAGPAQIRRAIQRMERLEVSTSEKRPFDLQISFGVASADRDNRKSPEAVYKTADERMYRMKKALKED